MTGRGSFIDVIIEVPAEAGELLAASGAYSFQKLDTERPTLMIGKTTYEGKYSDIVGTNLLFDPARKSAAGYTGAATKRLVFQRVEGDDRDAGADDAKDCRSGTGGRKDDATDVHKGENTGAEREVNDGGGDAPKDGGSGTGVVGRSA